MALGFIPEMDLHVIPANPPPPPPLPHSVITK